MYSKKSWGGSVDPYIMVKFLADKSDAEDPLASLIIFEWEDEDLIGQYRPNVNPDEFDAQKDFICDSTAVEQKLCQTADIGSFILMPNATDLSKTAILNEAVHLKDPKAVSYPIKKTGYYCVTTFAYSDRDYTAAVEFRNAYGELPAAQIAKLPFYGGLTITYAVLGIFKSEAKRS